jgi:imidazolonepropionase-like amidohydrolase
MKQLRNWWVLAVLISSMAASATRARQSQPAPPPILVKASRLLDPRTGNVLAPAAVLIEGDKIMQVGSPSQISAPNGAKIIDLGRATLLPGLIDSHTHLLVDPVLPAEAERARHYNGSFVPGILLAIVESPS